MEIFFQNDYQILTLTYDHIVAKAILLNLLNFKCGCLIYTLLQQ